MSRHARAKQSRPKSRTSTEYRALEAPSHDTTLHSDHAEIPGHCPDIAHLSDDRRASRRRRLRLCAWQRIGAPQGFRVSRAVNVKKWGLHSNFACPRSGTPRASLQLPPAPGGDIRVKPEVVLTPPSCPGSRTQHTRCAETSKPPFVPVYL